jgi:hypothetical protein
MYWKIKEKLRFRDSLNILLYIQQDATLHSLFYLETALHVSGGTSTHHQERKQLYPQHLLFNRPLLLPSTVNFLIYMQQDTTLHGLLYLETALHISGGTSPHHQKRKQLYLQYLLFVTPLLLLAVIAAGSSNGVTNTRYCIYSCLRSWWWVEVPPDTCRAVSIYNKLCNVASCWIYIGILKKLLVGTELYYTNGRTDIMKLRVTFENQRFPLRHNQNITTVASPEILVA